MALATYSAGTGTTEAFSKTLLTDVLALLPDNTIKEISPRDVRDAVFSTWENSPFRYTSNGTTDYIGIAREDVKDMTIFLGKKQISGTNIMSSSLLNSDTDIFLYNTKLDSDPTQDFKVSFLAGSSSGVFQMAPYMRAAYVNATPSFITLDIVNPATYGTITLQSGPSASISINSLQWPSTGYVNYVVNNSGNASQSIATDLFLTVGAGMDNIQLKTYASLGNSLGGPGQPVNIQGSPVNLNGFALEFSNSNPILATFGGIGIGMTFSNVPLITMIEMMLYPYLVPLASVSFSGLQFNNTFERNNSSGNTFNYQYTIYKRTNDILTTDLQLQSSDGTTYLTPPESVGITASGTGLVTSTTQSSFALSNGEVSALLDYPDNTLTFSCQVYDGTQSYTDYENLTAVYPYFYGFDADNVNTAGTYMSDVLNSQTKRVDTKTNLEVGLNGTDYLYFSYPQVYGTLSSIVDGNSFSEYTHGDFNTWTYSIWNINSPTSLWSAKDYYVYKKNLISTINNQNYKFNF
jgi:hypothetical protein